MSAPGGSCSALPVVLIASGAAAGSLRGGGASSLARRALGPGAQSVLRAKLSQAAGKV